MTIAPAADVGLRGVDLTALAAGARRVTGSDHALIIVHGESGVVATRHDGLPHGELALLERLKQQADVEYAQANRLLRAAEPDKPS